MSTLDETRIAALVDRFYDKVRADASIGPIFNAAVHDWPGHKALLTRFWCSVALGAQSYRGNPMAVHRGQPTIRAVHFARWLELQVIQSPLDWFNFFPFWDQAPHDD